MGRPLSPPPPFPGVLGVPRCPSTDSTQTQRAKLSTCLRLLRRLRECNNACANPININNPTGEISAHLQLTDNYAVCFVPFFVRLALVLCLEERFCFCYFVWTATISVSCGGDLVSGASHDVPRYTTKPPPPKTESLAPKKVTKCGVLGGMCVDLLDFSLAGGNSVLPAERFPLHPAAVGATAGLRHSLRDADAETLQVRHKTAPPPQKKPPSVVCPSERRECTCYICNSVMSKNL